MSKPVKNVFLNADTLNSNAKILVVVTTCSRPRFIRSYLKNLKQRVSQVKEADLVVAVDGLSQQGNRESLDIALSFGVSCIVSDFSEGVGISKNRVLALFGGYDYYFFLEDDVEVLSSRLFSRHVDLYLETGIHHFSLHKPEWLRDVFGSTILSDGVQIRYAMYGSAQVNFFTREALERVGGWHLDFAKIRRGGHTEHSYRIYHSQMCPAPFNFCDDLLNACIWRDPPHVVDPSQTAYKLANNFLFELENELMAEKIKFMPFSANSVGRLINP